MRLKIFSYNIHGLPFLPDSWSEPLYEWFNCCDYDFICIQEAFTPGRVEGLTKSLIKNGYTVLKPNDLGARRLLGSGLLTAVRADRWIVKESGFVAYEQCAGAEQLANKGFHWLKLGCRDAVAMDLLIVNTHMQADHYINYFAGCMDTRPIRKHQMDQIMAYLETAGQCRSLIIGDLNSEDEVHDELVYLTGPKNGICKHTFEPTGEDLDHVAFVPRKWMNYVLPVIHNIEVLSLLWWSDHWPIHVVLEFIL